MSPRQRVRRHAGQGGPPPGRQPPHGAADGPAQPGRPQRVAHVVRAAHLLYRAQTETQHQRRAQPPGGRARRHAAQPEPAGQVRKAGRRVPGRKAVAATAIGHAPQPVRHVACGAAEFLQIPRAAGQAGALDQRHGQHRRHHPQQQPDALAARQAPQHAERAPDHQRQQRRQPPRRIARAIVQHLGQQPVAAVGKAAGIAEPARQRQIEPAGVPHDQRQQTERTGGQPHRGGRWRGCAAGLSAPVGAVRGGKAGRHGGDRGHLI